ncbi:hypothetical protein N7447_002170 [Penicillium robsamsonii]|nr:hypothetical protein N7447_002170 [Penicillium robsamsonii]
MGARYAR